MISGDLSKPPPSASRPPHRGEIPKYTTVLELREPEFGRIVPEIFVPASGRDHRRRRPPPATPRRPREGSGSFVNEASAELPQHLRFTRVSQCPLPMDRSRGWQSSEREPSSQGGPLRFSLDVPSRESTVAPAADTAVAQPMLTRDELKRLERESIARALEHTNGKVSGPGGAAELLELRPTTRTSFVQ